MGLPLQGFWFGLLPKRQNRDPDSEALNPKP